MENSERLYKEMELLGVGWHTNTSTLQPPTCPDPVSPLPDAAGEGIAGRFILLSACSARELLGDLVKNKQQNSSSLLGLRDSFSPEILSVSYQSSETQLQ